MIIFQFLLVLFSLTVLIAEIFEPDLGDTRDRQMCILAIGIFLIATELAWK